MPKTACGTLLIALIIIVMTAYQCAKKSSLPWPIRLSDIPQDYYTIGNHHGQYQRFGETDEVHLGVDLLALHKTPVYPIEDGRVVLIDEGGGDPERRGVVVASDENAVVYLHLESIKPKLGADVTTDKPLGYVVHWTESCPSESDEQTCIEYDHLHFSRVKRYGSLLQPKGLWTGYEEVGDPLALLGSPPDDSAPSVEKKIYFAEDENETSDYLDDVKEGSKVDIIIRVQDKSHSKSPWEVIPRRVDIAITREGNLYFSNEVLFDQPVGDVGPASQHMYRQDENLISEGNYSSRTFYLIVTNSPYDQNGFWEPQPGVNKIRLTVEDHAGRTTEETVTITVP